MVLYVFVCVCVPCVLVCQSTCLFELSGKHASCLFVYVSNRQFCISSYMFICPSVSLFDRKSSTLAANRQTMCASHSVHISTAIPSLCSTAASLLFFRACQDGQPHHSKASRGKCVVARNAWSVCRVEHWGHNQRSSLHLWWPVRNIRWFHQDLC